MVVVDEAHHLKNRRTLNWSAARLSQEPSGQQITDASWCMDSEGTRSKNSEAFNCFEDIGESPILQG